MEDVSVLQDVLAVLDGHGGRECADFIAPQIRKLAGLPQEQWIGAFIALDDDFRAQSQPSGCTCVAAVPRADVLEIANIGDSRAVLFRNGLVVEHTIDHKPGAKSERERILRSGGSVEESGDGPARVGGVAVSRAFGTYVGPCSRKMLKDPALPHEDRLVSCVPELFSWPTQKGDVLVIACDGIWDVLSEEDVGAALLATCDLAQRARLICDKALQTSTDNVSCIVAELGGTLPVLPPPASDIAAKTRQRHLEERPSFNRASHEEQLEIGRALAYGETLIEIMQNLETDLVIEGLWLGQTGDACFSPFLEYAKIRKVINCAAEVERPDMDGIAVSWLKWWDSEDQGKAEAKGSFKRLRQATRSIHDSMEAGDVVLVHCVQGISRSASVVVAFLMEYRQMPIEDAVSLVKQAHPGALKPFRFQEMLRAFDYFLKAERS